MEGLRPSSRPHHENELAKAHCANLRFLRGPPQPLTPFCKGEADKIPPSPCTRRTQGTNSTAARCARRIWISRASPAARRETRLQKKPTSHSAEITTEPAAALKTHADSVSHTNSLAKPAPWFQCKPLTMRTVTGHACATCGDNSHSTQTCSKNSTSPYRKAPGGPNRGGRGGRAKGGRGRGGASRGRGRGRGQ